MEPEENQNLPVEPDIAQRNLDLVAGSVSGQMPPSSVVRYIGQQVVEQHKKDIELFLVALVRSRMKQAAEINQFIQTIRARLRRKLDLEQLNEMACLDLLEREEKSLELQLKFIDMVFKHGIEEQSPAGNRGDTVNIDNRQVIIAGNLRDVEAKGSKMLEGEVLPPQTSRERVRELIDKLLEVRRDAGRTDTGTTSPTG